MKAVFWVGVACVLLVACSSDDDPAVTASTSGDDGGSAAVSQGIDAATSEAEASATETPEVTSYIGLTGGVGVSLRDRCDDSARIGGSLAEGTLVRVLPVGHRFLPGMELRRRRGSGDLGPQQVPGFGPTSPRSFLARSERRDGRAAIGHADGRSRRIGAADVPLGQHEGQHRCQRLRRRAPLPPGDRPAGDRFLGGRREPRRRVPADAGEVITFTVNGSLVRTASTYRWSSGGSAFVVFRD